MHFRSWWITEALSGVYDLGVLTNGPTSSTTDKYPPSSTAISALHPASHCSQRHTCAAGNLTFFVDGDAEGVVALALGFYQGLARVFDSIGAAVALLAII